MHMQGRRYIAKHQKSYRECGLKPQSNQGRVVCRSPQNAKCNPWRSLEINTRAQSSSFGARTTNIVKQSDNNNKNNNDNGIYLEEIIDIISIALTELMHMFDIQEVVVTLMCVDHGQSIICPVVTEMPALMKNEPSAS